MEKRELLIRLLEGKSRGIAPKDTAVIGISGRYPQSGTPRLFWENLKQGKNCITQIPGECWDWREYYEPVPPKQGKMYSKWGGFIRDADKFDPMFFNILPTEAENMDPQERLFLEIVWNLLEDAGYTRKEITKNDKKVGVFVGIMNSNYEWIGGEEWARGNISIATSSFWSVANRVSYFFDFEGPSLAVDTACSSSLTAIHLASESIKRGECHTAVAGGVNLILHPKHFIRLSTINMLTEDDRCKSFGIGANGFVGGEGVGAVLLKSLEAALKDGDNIYGVIKGSSMNASGKTSGYTVPNPNTQGDLIREVLTRTNIHPRTIGYLEAHGTGTSLGDPIEIAGLVKAYGQSTRDKQYCSIGSVKSNIGHLESAAGIAGLTKVLLQLKHKQLAPSLHSEEPNPHIDFRDSPFYLQHRLTPWEKPVINENGEEKEYPRRAGLSSFGAGGANVHVILEEYEYETPSSPADPGTTQPAVIVLSARNEERLKVKVKDLVEFLTGASQPPFNLAEIAYTLQIGREAMEERLALMVSGVQELVEKLERYLQGKDDAAHFACSPSSPGNLEKLARSWIAGAEIDWELLYPTGTPRRISLPTYPFAGERYWIPKSADRSGQLRSLHSGHSLHPLVGSNTSDLEEQKYTTRFLGNEFFFTHHVIRGQKVLPGAVYLEMARAGGTLAARKQVVKIKDIAWVKPVLMEENPRDIHLGLFPQRDTVEFEVHSPGEEDRRITHSRGKLYFREETRDKDRTGTGSIDIETIKGRCPETITGQECYRLFREKGVEYGTCFQSIHRVWGSDTEALSLLKLPAACPEQIEGFELHPVMLDGALQTIIGIGSAQSGPGLHLPFAIGEIELKKPLPETCYVHAAICSNKHTAAASAPGVRRFNLRVLDEAGQELVRITDFSIREYRQVKSKAPEESQSDHAGEDKDSTDETNTGINTGIDTNAGIKEAAENFLKALLSRETKLLVQKIDAGELLEKYGIDSLTVLNLTRELEGHFGELSKSLFYEYKTIRELAGYFLENHAEKLAKAIGKAGDASHGKPGLPAGESSRSPGFKRPRFINGRTSRNRPADPVDHGYEDIAVIGMSGRYPGAGNLEVFWENLCSGSDCIEEIPIERWDYRPLFDPDREKTGRIYSKWGGFIADADKFDSLFFNMSPREAELTDPQERLFLETVWHTVEDAGYTRKHLQEYRVGVFVGIMWSQYQLLTGSINGDKVVPSASLSSIANRVSYFFNFSGPSIALDTMCSSSLTSIHLACRSIHRGESHLAVAGGVNLSIHENKYILLSQQKFASGDGRCRSFGQGGDGYVPGEGVGAVLLKRLSQAEADGDHIYAVIKGSAINHGGRTNGYSVPNPLAQAEVIELALQDARIDARTISYLEAHGTGTSLGDPIEITGLKKTYEKYTADKQYCSLGSVKSNVGHLESAAGIAGLTKIVLQMKHKKLVPSLHASTLNPFIDFQDSPFYVQQELTGWQQPLINENGEEKRYPRRAGLSSFGAGGTNVHIVIEEYENPAAGDQSRVHQDNREPQLIVLSARNRERLKVYAEKLVSFLDKITPDRTGPPGNFNLSGMAYTLQVGREALPERMALLVSDSEELKTKLNRYCRGETTIENLYTGNIKKNKDRVELLAESREGDKFLEILIADRKLAKLGNLWVYGVDVRWESLYPEGLPGRIPLPTYPFARQRHWVPGIGKAAAVISTGQGPAAKFHPLIDANISTLREEKFSTCLTGTEFYLADHVVAGQKVLPGVVYLEMARAAGEFAGEQQVRKIKDVVWMRPAAVTGEPREIQISLNPDNDCVNFQVSSPGEDYSPMIHSRGKLLFGSKDPEQDPPALEVIDLEAVKKQCPGFIAGEEFYNRFQAVGLEYGPGFRAVQEVFAGDREVLSRLTLPEKIKQEFHQYLLHPALLDGALQTIMGLTGGNGDDTGGSYLPFSLGELEIIAPLTQLCYAYVTPTGNWQETRSPVRKFDIRLVDDNGQVLVKIKDFSLREFKSATQTKPAAATAASGPALLCYASQWEEAELNLETPGSAASESMGPILVFDIDADVYRVLEERLAARGNGKESNPRVILVKPGKDFQDMGNLVFEIDPTRKETYSRLVEELHSCDLTPDKMIHLWSRGQWTGKGYSMNTQLDRGVYSLFYLSQALMEQKQKASLRLLYCYPGNKPGEDHGESRLISQPFHAAVSGFARSLRQENPGFMYKTVEIPDMSLTSQQWPDFLLHELQTRTNDDFEIRLHDGRRCIKRLQEIDLAARVEPPPQQGQSVQFVDKGVYIITGGTGALGLIFARFLAQQVKARLVLTDFTDLTAEKKNSLDTLEALSTEILFIKADISKKEEVKKLISSTKSRFKAINGVIHCAGVTRDSFIIKKTRQEFAAVLAPKLSGALHLDELTAGEPLDFFVLFSSTSVLGNAGQADYAFANSFMDHFAMGREALRTREKRSGKTLSINWPLWKEGGMQVNPQTRQWMEQKFGMVPLETEAGLEFFRMALGGRTNPLMCMAGNREKLNLSLGIRETQKSGPDSQSQPPTGDKFREKVEQDLMRLCSQLLKVKISDLDTTEELGNYGLDSIMMITLMNRIETLYGDTVEPNALVEFPSIKELAVYLIDQGVAKPGTAVHETPAPVPGKSPVNRFVHVQAPHRPAASPTDPAGSDLQKIAVIGLACRFSRSHSPELFWENLKNGTNLITEVPGTRWNSADYYSPDRQAPGKTYSKWGGFIEDVDLFDADFFGISTEDALVMDPQQRILLELTRELLDRAGYTGKEIHGTRTSVWLGGGESSYIKNQYDHIPADYMKRLLVNSIQNMLASRVSDFYNLKGASQIIDTACSSSLVAIHQACQELKRGEADIAIAGGIELLLDPYLHIGFSKAGVLSDEHKLYVFDERAKGFILGEGVGLVLLKPYHKAREDGDRILGVILGSSVNNDGHTMGLTTPGLEGQKHVIKKTLEISQVNPATISYLEAHGTGTLLGDPIEIKALTQVYREYTPNSGYCAVGSVKSNMGHLIRAAGIASFIKVMLALENRKIPPTLHCQKPHPRFRFDGSPFYPITGCKDWELLEGTRRAGISSFGFGGTNCHMIVEAGPEPGKAKQTPAYIPRRTPLPLTQFNRRRYWLGKEILSEAEIKPAKPVISGNNQLDLIKKLEQGEITIARVMELLHIN